MSLFQAFSGISNQNTPATTGSAGQSGIPASDAQALREDVERLLMITEALWSIVKEDKGWTDHELMRRIAEIDLRDGRLDGRVAPSPPESCPSCSRILSRGRTRCLYCGKLIKVKPFQR